MITAPAKLREQRRRVRRDDRDERLLPDAEKVEARRLPLRQHRHARGARRVGARRDGGADDRVTRLGIVGLLAVVARRLRAVRLRARSRAGTSACAIRSGTRRSSRAHAKNYHLEPPLLAAVIYTESKFDADARSAAGAIGLMQLLPETAQGIAVRTGGDGLAADDLSNPELNVRYGAWYLRHLLDKYDDEERARGLPRRPGERRPLARARRRDPVPRDAALRRACRQAQGDVRTRVRRRARPLVAAVALSAARHRAATPATPRHAAVSTHTSARAMAELSLGRGLRCRVSESRRQPADFTKTYSRTILTRCARPR